ncbi:unnamed protein product [Trichobilharzia regenti]|nr:unnamed protein product [Trichobilharzia regenti]
MVNQRISEPSSPNSTNGDGDDDNSNNILHGINNGVVINWNSYPTDANGIEDDNNDDDLTNQTAPIGYVLLGSEVLHAADDGGDDSEADDDDDALSDSNLFVGTVEDTSHIELWNENTPPSTSQITITPGTL